MLTPRATSAGWGAAHGPARGAAVPPALRQPGAQRSRRPGHECRPAVRRPVGRRRRAGRGPDVDRAVPAVRAARHPGRGVGGPVGPQADPDLLRPGPPGDAVGRGRAAPVRSGRGRPPGRARRGVRVGGRVLRARVQRVAADDREPGQHPTRQRAAGAELLAGERRRAGRGRRADRLRRWAGLRPRLRRGDVPGVGPAAAPAAVERRRPGRSRGRAAARVVRYLPA